MDLHAALSLIESSISDPRQGLPPDLFLFVSRLTPLINVDLLIQDEGSRTLLTWRDDEFYGPGWHVPGGIVRYKETTADRIRACADEELGAAVSYDPVPLLLSESIGEQRTRGHFISLLFRCRLLSAPDESRRGTSGAPAMGEWRWHDRSPPDLLNEQRQYARFIVGDGC